ncbi:extracellular calcium-sensing receptor-like [Protopterus annectens]|uniref:extracellular calcium-sensing receptor-like n=1 Tax=Protopterus annectens TaxID=7888 RepID=UPI001CFAB05F|nr:extracellular calcium-sensing receptor-like [Protopterus annectens]
MHKNFRIFLATVFAITEINQNPELLPNITLGFRLYDSCYSEVRALEGISWLMTGQEDTVPNYSCHAKSVLAGVIGEAGSGQTIPMARMLGVFKYPQVSYGSVVRYLSNKHLFPSFLRTVPPDNSHALSLAKFLMHFGWTWAGIVASDNDYGLVGALDLKREFSQIGGCIDYLEAVPLQEAAESILHIIDVIKSSTAKVVILYLSMPQVVQLVEAVSVQNVTGKIWIDSTAWTITPIFYRKEVWVTLNGTVGLTFRKGAIPGFREFLYSIHPSTSSDDIFVIPFWEEAFHCKWQSSVDQPMQTWNVISENITFCTGMENLQEVDNSIFDVLNFRLSYSTYNAAYCLAHALHNLQMCVPGRGPFVNGSCANIHTFQPWQLFHYIRNVHFINKVGEEIFFDVNGDSSPIYDIVNWQMYNNGSNRYINVGKVEPNPLKGQTVLINEKAISWGNFREIPPRSVCTEKCIPGFRKAAQQGKQICCYDCIPCSKGKISNQTDASECTSCAEDEWSNDKHDRCVSRIIEFLSYEEPISIILTAISIQLTLLTAIILCIFIKYRDTPIVRANNRELSYVLLFALMLCFTCSLLFIGRPTKITCMLRQVAFGVIFSVCVSSILAKTLTVVIAFNATKPSSKLRKWVGAKVPITIILLCSFLQFFICLAWLLIAPPFLYFNTTTDNQKIIIECNEGVIIFFYLMLGYMGFLAIVSLVVAFLARKLPDSFNEAKFITFSMLVFVTVWLSFIPAYLSTQGKYMVAVEIFAILSSSAGLLCCIFFPKCFIILLRPELNSRENIVGKKKNVV